MSILEKNLEKLTVEGINNEDLVNENLMFETVGFS